MASNSVDASVDTSLDFNSFYTLTEQRQFSTKGDTYPLKFKQFTPSNASVHDPKLSSILLTTSAETTLRYIDTETLVTLGELKGHTDVITDVTFSKTTPFIVWSSSLDGSIRGWDLRTNKSNDIIFQPFNEEKLLSVSCSANDEFLCSGAESKEDEEEEKSNLYIWDARMKIDYQIYSEVFAASVDHCVFNPDARHSLLTGCRDGLVNVFDIREKEEDACQYVLNVENGVSQLNFYNSDSSSIYCITDEGGIYLWEASQGNEIFKFPKMDIPDTDDVINCFYDNKRKILATAAGNGKGDVLIAVLTEVGGVKPWISLNSGHQDRVRALHMDFENERIITSCEDGTINIWKHNLAQEEKENEKMIED